MLSDLLAESNPWWRAPEVRLADAQPFARKHLEIVVEYLERGDRGVALVGPRQVGKTVLMKQAVEHLLGRRPGISGGAAPLVPPQNITFISFDDDRITAEISLRDVVDVRPAGLDVSRPRFFFFDEISKVPRWDAALKQAIDRTRHGPDRADHRFVVSDSAGSLLSKGRIESGEGRWDELEVESWTFGEFLALNSRPGEAQDAVLPRFPTAVEEYLVRGGFPAHLLAHPPVELVHRRLRADIIDVAIYKDLARQKIDADRARRFFVYLAQNSGSEQNLADRARDLGADPRSVEGWLDLLRTAGLLRRLDRHQASARAVHRLKPISKYFAGDHGLVAALSIRPAGVITSDPRLVETVVFRHLRELPVKDLAYFRGRDDLECDFVVGAADGLVAIEVTTADPGRHDKIATLERAAKELSAVRSIVIHSGLEEGERSGVTLLPLHRFLLEPERILPRNVEPR